MSNAALGQNRNAATFWSTRREASLNWLALGLLLAAWNATDRVAAERDAPRRDAADRDVSTNARRRPEALRGYSYVSVRAVSRVAKLD